MFSVYRSVQKVLTVLFLFVSFFSIFFLREKNDVPKRTKTLTSIDTTEKFHIMDEIFAIVPLQFRERFFALGRRALLLRYDTMRCDERLKLRPSDT